MNHTVRSSRRAGGPLGRLALMLVALLLAAGCGGSSGGDSVFTGTGGNNNNNNNFGNGQVTFNFVKPQAALEVPQDTTTIRFRFFDDLNATGNIVQQDTEAFAAQITLDVTAAARSVEVTAYAADGTPLVQAVVNINVLVDGTIVVDFAVADVQTVTIANLTVVPQTAAVIVGGTKQFSATANYTSGDVLPATGATWTSTAAASIDEDTGLATGEAEGIATITATLGGATGSATLTVSDTVVALTVDPQTASTLVGDDFDFDVTGEDADGNPEDTTGVVWSVSGNIATIDQTGNVSSTGSGTVTVTATLGNVSDSATLTIDPRPTGSILLDPSPTSQVTSGGTLDFSVTALDDELNPVSTVGAVFTVAPGGGVPSGDAVIDPTTGQLLAIAEGFVTVTVDFDGFSDTCVVEIFDFPGDLIQITSNPASILFVNGLDIGGTRTLVITGEFEEETRVVNNNDDGVTFTTVPFGSNVVSVDPETGVITGLRQGTATVRAMLGSEFVDVPVEVNFNNGNGVGTGTNLTPILNLQGVMGNVPRSTNTTAFGTTTFDDDQGNLSGGTIRIQADDASIDINVPGGMAPTIGSAPANDSDDVLVTLNTAATPAAIQTFLRGVTFDTSASAIGVKRITVTVDDGGNPASVDAVQFRDYTIVGAGARNLTVNPANPETGDNYQTIAAALTAIANINGLGGENSTIAVVAGNFTAETLNINDPDHVGLTLTGNNANISGGVTPGTRLAESRVTRMDVQVNGVTINGFRFETGSPAMTEVGLNLTSTANETTVSNSIFLGGGSATDLGIANTGVADPPEDVTITNCGFTGWFEAISLDGTNGGQNLTDLTITGCAFSVNENAVVMVAPNNVTITGNGFTASDDGNPDPMLAIAGLHLSADMDTGASVIATGNEFSALGIVQSINNPAMGSATLDAGACYWGPNTPDGPLASQLDQGAMTNLITFGFLLVAQDPFPNFGPTPPVMP